MISRNKAIYKQYIEPFRHPDTNQFHHACHTFFAKDANIHAVHPFNDLNGPDEYIEQILNSLLGSFENLYRTDYMMYMRVCDWWRREGDLLTENWVFVDIPHLLLQMDYDVFNPAS